MNHKHFCVFLVSVSYNTYLFFHLQMTQLAKTCTNRDPKQRPRMRAVVVSLMKLNSTIDDGSMIVSEALSPTMEHDD
jgi:hypothetical protein